VAFVAIDGRFVVAALAHRRRKGAEVGKPPTKSDEDVMVCLVTAPRDDAGRIAKAVVERGLAACCNVIEKVSSFYVWKGTMQEDCEALMVLKTTEAASRELVSLVRELHPYDLPEVILLPVGGGSEEYLRWVVKACCHRTMGD
jgi:periplasmic divalent cation tolerance protein